jgi:hypothetical protein
MICPCRLVVVWTVFSRSGPGTRSVDVPCAVPSIVAFPICAVVHWYLSFHEQGERQDGNTRQPVCTHAGNHCEGEHTEKYSNTQHNRAPVRVDANTRHAEIIYWTISYGPAYQNS